jgi:AbiV family abortive infection protein
VAKKRSSGPLTANQLCGIAEASLLNARQMISLARNLFVEGEYSTAYSIGVVAGEEFGKCQLAVGSVGLSDADDDYWKEWWKVFYSHGPKLVRAAQTAPVLLPAELMESFVSLLGPALRDQRRERGFYVEVVDGVVEIPEVAISESEAEALVNCFSWVIEGYASWLNGRSLSSVFMEANAGPAIEMRLALSTGDEEHIRKVWRASTGQPIDEAVLNQFLATQSREIES